MESPCVGRLKVTNFASHIIFCIATKRCAAKVCIAKFEYPIRMIKLCNANLCWQRNLHVLANYSSQILQPSFQLQCKIFQWPLWPTIGLPPPLNRGRKVTDSSYITFHYISYASLCVNKLQTQLYSELAMGQHKLCQHCASAVCTLYCASIVCASIVCASIVCASIVCATLCLLVLPLCAMCYCMLSLCDSARCYCVTCVTGCYLVLLGATGCYWMLGAMYARCYCVLDATV